MQWNIDVIGDDSPEADAEIIACTVRILECFKLSPELVTIKLSHRDIPKHFLLGRGATEDQLPVLFDLTDRKDKLSPEKFREYGKSKNVSDDLIDSIDEMINQCKSEEGTRRVLDEARNAGFNPTGFSTFINDINKDEALEKWCKVDPSIVRGLAYYTGTVFEVHEATGKERAIAGGGRYDDLIKMFGGPPTPAVGIAMGDVVLRLVLEDHGLLESAAQYMPRPDVFFIAAKEEADEILKSQVAKLRGNGLHVRHSYRATRNVGKLLGEAGKVRAKLAIILGEELADGLVTVKNLDSGDQESVRLDELTSKLPALLGNCGE